MKMRVFLISLWIAIVILVACGSKESEPESLSNDSSPATQQPREHIFSTQERALRKAQDLNRQVDEHDKEMRKKLGEAFK